MFRYCRLLLLFSKHFPLRLELSQQIHLKIIFSLQYGKFASIVRLSFILKSSGALPKYCKTQVNSLLGAMKLTSLWINYLFKNFLIQ